MIRFILYCIFAVSTVFCTTAVAQPDAGETTTHRLTRIIQEIAKFKLDPEGRFQNFGNLNEKTRGFDNIPRQFICTFPQGNDIADFIRAEDKYINQSNKITSDENTSDENTSDELKRVREFERDIMDIAAWDLFISANRTYQPENGSRSANTDALYPPRWGSWPNPDDSNTDIVDRKTFRIKEVALKDNRWRCEGDCLSTTISIGVFPENSGVKGGGVLIDQAGNPVFYESRGNTLLSQRLVTDSVKNQPFLFPMAQCTTFIDIGLGQGGEKQDINPVVTVKVAWKILTDTDDPSHYMNQKKVKIMMNNAEQEVTLGVVGMHLAIKEQRQRRWRWVTFEHVDNLFEPEQGAAAQPSFYNPKCKDCCPNLLPVNSKPAQITRIHKMDDKTIEVNKKVRRWLKKQGSILQHYKLVGTQYASLVGANSPYPLLKTPEDLRSAVFEPFVLPAAPRCDQSKSIIAEKYIQPDPNKFHTTGCMGCHEGAKFYPNGDKSLTPQKADFVFLPPIDFITQEKTPNEQQ
jgi:hypothetical protein